MFPETFVEHWVGSLSKKGEVVLDPFAGRGTTPFQSLLMERGAVASDVNDVAYCVSAAKTNAPTLRAAKKRLSELEQSFDLEEYRAERESLPIFFRYAFQPWTLAQLLHLRKHLAWRTARADCMIAAVTLGILHGESERSSTYLSCQMPRTISTKPDYSVRFWQRHQFSPPWRDSFESIRKQLDYRYESEVPDGRAIILHGDMRELPSRLGAGVGKIKHVITSPPYFDVTNFEEDQWLRLWFLGGPPVPTRNRLSRDDRYGRDDDYWNFIGDLWRMLGQVLAPRANIVMRIGAISIPPEKIASMVLATAAFARRKVQICELALSQIRGRQTGSFTPGTRGCSVEVDCHLRMN
jgi:hypothetical protein